jgi:hypothetical protein
MGMNAQSKLKGKTLSGAHAKFLAEFSAELGPGVGVMYCIMPTAEKQGQRTGFGGIFDGTPQNG